MANLLTMKNGSILKRQGDNKHFVVTFCSHWSDIQNVDDPSEKDSVKWFHDNEFIGHCGPIYTLVCSVFLGSEFLREKDLKIFKVVDKSNSENQYVLISDDLTEQHKIQWKDNGFHCSTNNDVFVHMTK